MTLTAPPAGPSSLLPGPGRGSASQEVNRRGRVIPLLWGIGLGVTAVAVEQVKIELLTPESPLFLFGGALVLVAFVAFGPRAGLAAALIARMPDLARLDGIGLVTAIYILEAVAVWRVSRRSRSLIVAVLVFWFSAGWLLDLVLYQGVLGLGFPYVLLVFAKQVLNGVLNATVAELLLLLPMFRGNRRSSDAPVPIRRHLLARMALVVTPFVTLLIVLFTRARFTGVLEDQLDRASRVALGTAGEIRQRLQERQAELRVLAHQLELIEDGVGSGQRLGRWSGLGFVAIMRTDTAGVMHPIPRVTSAAGERLAGLSLGGLRFFQSVRSSLMPAVSRLMVRDDLLASLADLPPHFLIVAQPMLSRSGGFDGVVAGAVSTDELAGWITRAGVASGFHVTIVDAERRIIATSDAGYHVVGGRLGLELSGSVADSPDGARFAFFSIPDGSREAELGINLRHAVAHLDPTTRWTTIVDLPAASVHQAMVTPLLQALGLAVVGGLLTWLVLMAFGRSVADPLRRASELATRISEGRVTEGPEEARPIRHSAVTEVRNLGTRLAQLAEAVTAREAMATALVEETTARFEAVSEATTDAVRDWSLSSGVVWWGAGFRSLFGYREGSLGQSAEGWWSRIHPEDVERVRSGLHGALDGAGKEWCAEYRFRKACGDWADVRDTLRIVRTGSGSPIRLIGSMVDLSELKRVAREREELERQVRGLQRLEAVGQLAGGVAHDFNNLLTPILGYSELLLANAPAGSSERDDLREIRDAAERARALTRQLLAFGRRQLLDLRVVELNAVVRRFLTSYRSMIREDVQVVLELSPETGAVRADPIQLEQILLNLLVNAQDAMPSGGRVRVATRMAHTAAPRGPGGPPAGRWAVLEVQDYGAGMSEETLDRIFEPFFTTKERGRGTGLGLATVHGIVQQHAGHISVQSEPEKGATFRVMLPEVNEAPTALPAMEPGRNGRDQAATVLVVEDDPAVRRFVCEALEAGGFRPLEAGNAASALTQVQVSSPPLDLLLTDVIMPGMDGAELARRLRVRYPGLAVLFMSGYSEDLLAHRGVSAPEVRLLSKPFAPAELLAGVTAAIESARGRAVQVVAGPGR